MILFSQASVCLISASPQHELQPWIHAARLVTAGCSGSLTARQLAPAWDPQQAWRDGGIRQPMSSVQGKAVPCPTADEGLLASQEHYIHKQKEHSIPVPWFRMLTLFSKSPILHKELNISDVFRRWQERRESLDKKHVNCLLERRHRDLVPENKTTAASVAKCEICKIFLKKGCCLIFVYVAA